jgi:hypothetical protein
MGRTGIDGLAVGRRPRRHQVGIAALAPQPAARRRRLGDRRAARRPARAAGAFSLVDGALGSTPASRIPAIGRGRQPPDFDNNRGLRAALFDTACAFGQT